MEKTYQRLMSIGPDCRAFYHIMKMDAFTTRTNLHISRRVFRKGVFAWQGTPSEAFIDYLRNDFDGMFERGDLAVRDGRVFNVRFGTSHLHAFSDPSEAGIDRHYAAARGRHDHLCAVAREAIDDPAPTAFIFGGRLPADVHGRIEHEIARRRDGALFDVIAIDDRNLPPTHEGTEAWTGNHEFWQGRLSSLGIHDGIPLPFRAMECLRDQVLRLKRYAPRARARHLSREA